MLEQKYLETINKIMSVIETGKLPSKESYSSCQILNDGAGISYGKHQSTDKSDTLDKIVFKYIDLNGLWAGDISCFTDLLEGDLTNIPSDRTNLLIRALKNAGEDPLMQKIQDEVFYNDYFKPAEEHCLYMDLKTPLAHLIIYDTCIQSGPGAVNKMRKLFPEVPPIKHGNEKVYLSAYLNARYKWLADFNDNGSKKEKLIRNSSKRVLELKKILDNGNMNLSLPISVFGIEIL